MKTADDDIAALKSALEHECVQGEWSRHSGHVLIPEGDNNPAVDINLKLAVNRLCAVPLARYIAAANPATIARLIACCEAAEADARRWQALYRRAVNEANGLTNYVEDRPELRSAERRLTAIETEARAAIARGEAAR